ncbi:MAG: hypothetical protein WB297_12460 [Actinomycetota bacterium]
MGRNQRGSRRPDASAFVVVDASRGEALEHAVRERVPTAGPRRGKRWVPGYFVRRVAWHVLDHAWEIEDRIR